MLHLSIKHWTPGIGDPTFMGWFTVFSYYCAALIIFITAFAPNLNTRTNDKNFRIFIFVSMVFLGICKQFDLPSAVTEIGKMLFTAEGLIEKRRIAQAFMMAGFLIVLFTTASILMYRFKRFLTKQYRFTLVIFLYLFAFVILRAISLHQYETILDLRILGLRLNWIGELAGIYGVCFSMLRFREGNNL